MDGLFALQNLLNGNENHSSDDEPSDHLGAKLGPGNIGASKKSDSKKIVDVYEKKVTKDIWDEAEVEEGAEFDTSDDPRPQPEYEILYKQKICTEDMYLGMSNKNNSTASCEDMVVKIKLPGVTKMSEIALELHDKFLDCRSTSYRLGLHLPHTVDTKQSNAKWDSQESTLIVTMTMNRELDFINF